MSAIGACPYCGVEIAPPPQRARKCKECGEKFWTRVTDDDPEAPRTLMTADERAEYLEGFAHRDAEAEALRSLGSRYSQADWDQAVAVLTRGGRPPSTGDVFWSLANQYIAENPRMDRETLEDIARLRWSMSVWIMRQEPHKDWRPHRRLAIFETSRAEAVAHREFGEQVVSFEVLASCDCEHCVEMTVFAADFGPSSGPLPHDGCATCSCSIMAAETSVLGPARATQQVPEPSVPQRPAPASSTSGATSSQGPPSLIRGVREALRRVRRR